MISYQQLSNEDWIEQKDNDLNYTLGYVLLIYIICVNQASGSGDKTEEICIACHD
jgi:hypothetical protein